MSNQEWPCSHVKQITKQGKIDWYYDLGVYQIPPCWIRCPECPAVRPKEPNALWERMEMLLKDIPLITDVHKRISKESVKWFKEILPEFNPMNNEVADYVLQIIKLLDEEAEKCK